MRQALLLLFALVLMLTPACSAHPVEPVDAPPAIAPISSQPQSHSLPAPPEESFSDPDQVMTAFVEALVTRDIGALGALTQNGQAGEDAAFAHWNFVEVAEGDFSLLTVDAENRSVYDLTLAVSQPDITRLSVGTAHYAVVVGPVDDGLRKAVLTVTPLELYQSEESWLGDPAVQMVHALRSIVTTAPFSSMYELEPAALAELGMSLAAQIGDPLACRPAYTQAELDVLVKRYFGLDSIDCSSVSRVFDTGTRRYRLIRRGMVERNERVVSVESDLNDVKTVVVERYSDPLQLVADARVSYTLFPNAEGDGSYHFGTAAEKQILHLPYRLPQLEKIPLKGGGFWERDPRAPGEMIETLMQALIQRDKRALAILGGSPTEEQTPTLDFVDSLSISDYSYSMLPVSDYTQMQFDLEITVRSAGTTVFREGTHRYLAVIAPTTRYLPGSYLAVRTIAPKERWIDPKQVLDNPAAWPAYFISRFARFDTFASPADIPTELLPEVLVSLACATYGEEGCTLQQLSESAQRYFGLKSVDTAALQADNRVFYNAEVQRYFLKNDAFRQGNERVVSIQTRIDNRVELLLERYSDPFQMVVEERILYTMAPNADGSYRIVSALEQPLAPKAPHETAAILPALGPLTLKGLQGVYAAPYGKMIFEQADWEKPEQLSVDCLVERAFFDVLYPASAPSPDYPTALDAQQRTCFTVPRELVERYLIALFGVTEEQLRTAKCYDAGRKAYLLGGQSKAELPIRSTVTAADFSADKSLLLLWTDVWLDGVPGGSRLLCEKLLTVRPAKDGSFQFDSVLTLKDYRVPGHAG